MRKDQEEVYEKIKKILINQFDVDEHLISWEADLMGTLGLSMMQFAELTIELERAFNVPLINSNILYLSTIGQLINFIVIHEKMNGKDNEDLL